MGAEKHFSTRNVDSFTLWNRRRTLTELPGTSSVKIPARTWSCPILRTCDRDPHTLVPARRGGASLGSLQQLFQHWGSDRAVRLGHSHGLPRLARWPGARWRHWCDLGLDRTGCYSSRQGDPANSKAIDGTRFQESKHLAHCFRSPRFLGGDLFVVDLS